MADLSDIQASLSVKLSGATGAGTETNYANVDASNNLFVVVNNGTSASAVNVQDGGNSLTIDSLQLPASLGQKTSALSLAVVLASDQTAIPVSQSGTWNINNISGTISLPTNAATSALQTTGNTSISSIDTKTPTQGQKTMANSSPVVIASDQSTVPVSVASLPLPTGASTAALQTTGNTSVASIDTKTPTIGQKTMANSRPVVIASDQVLTITNSPLPTSGAGFAFGQLATNTSAAFLIVEATTYTEQTTNGQRSIASASASDAAAGTGARTVTITYLDATGAGPFTETLTLNGTTGVNTVNTNICFIEKIMVNTVGSTGSNVGIISLYTAINKGGSIFASIAVTANQTFWAHHYIPTAKTCYISGISYSNNSTAAGNGATFLLRSSTPTIANSAPAQISDTLSLAGAASTTTRLYDSPLVVAGPAKVAGYVLPYANAATTQYIAFDYIDN